jgi:hypothetical protein
MGVYIRGLCVGGVGMGKGSAVMGYAFGGGPVVRQGQPQKLKCHKCFAENHGVVGDICVLCLLRRIAPPKVLCRKNARDRVKHDSSSIRTCRVR